LNILIGACISIFSTGAGASVLLGKTGAKTVLASSCVGLSAGVAVYLIEKILINKEKF
jgi:hypothetical protein